MLSTAQKRYIGTVLGKDALQRIMLLDDAHRPYQEILKFIAKLAAAKTQQHSKAERTETVKITPSASAEGVVYKSSGKPNTTKAARDPFWHVVLKDTK